MAITGLIFMFMFILTGAAILALVVAGFKTSQEAVQNKWTEHASQMGLDVGSSRRSAADMSGKIRGFDVKVEKTPREQKVKLRFPRALDMGLCLTHQSYYDRAARWLGNQDIEIGDEEFDRRVVVQGNKNRVAQFLTDDRRAQILDLFDLDDAFMIMDKGISLKTEGRTLNSSDLSQYLKKMVEVAMALTADEKKQSARKRAGRKSPPPAAKLPDAAEKKTPPKTATERTPNKTEQFYHKYGDILQTALSTARQDIATGKFAGRKSDLYMASIMVANRQFNEAAKLLDKIRAGGPVKSHVPAATDLSSMLPDTRSSQSVKTSKDKEPKTAIEERSIPEPKTDIELREENHDESEVPVEVEESGGAEVPVEVEEPGLNDESHDAIEEQNEVSPEIMTAAALCEELFTKLGTGAALRRFEQDFENTEVEWTGRLERLDTFITDPTFPSDTQLVAVLSIHSESEEFSASRVGDVLVSFPETAESDLRSSLGKTVELSGTLFEMKPFMRHLYVRDGQVTVGATG